MKKLKYLGTLAIFSAMPFVVNAQVTLTNPLGETDVRLLIARVIQGVLGISGSIALVMFIYGGILWLISGGQPNQIEKGKKVLTWAIFGIIIITGAYVITQAVFSALLTGNTAL